MDPLSLGLMGIGGIGSLVGMFTGNDDAPTYADINLQRDNPDLWRELQQLQAMSKEYERLYARRQMGPTAQEKAQAEQGRSRNEEQLATRGMLGSSTGNRLQADYNAQIMNAIQQRAFQEQQQLLAAQMQAKQAYAQQFGQAQQGALQAAMGQFQNKQQGHQAQNQFFGGLFNAGVGMMGNQMYADQMNAAQAKARPNYYSQGVPGAAPSYAMAPVYDYSQMNLLPPQIIPRDI